MFSLNKAQILGNMTRDPEVRYTPSGQAVANFGVATNRRWKNAQGEQQEETQFHDIVAWGKLAEIISQILKKGNRVYVEGRLQTRSWDGQDGIKRNRTEIVMENFIPLTPKGEAAADIAGAISPVSPAVPPPVATGKETSAKEEKSVDTSEIKPKKSKAKGKEKEEDIEEINLDDLPF